MNEKNERYYCVESPSVSVITPVYNRKTELIRCMDSVKRQTYKDFEYIIVNDGSTENLDCIVHDFMRAVPFPVLYVKKENGGVHTARNMGIKYARGKMIAMLDSDDEFIPDALRIFMDTWNAIPNKNEYAEIKAMCIDQHGKRLLPDLPVVINTLPIKKAWAMIRKYGGGGMYWLSGCKNPKINALARGSRNHLCGRRYCLGISSQQI